MGFHAPDMADMMAEMSAIQKGFQASKSHLLPTCPSLGSPGLVTSLLNSFPKEPQFYPVITDMYFRYWESLFRINYRVTWNKICCGICSETSDGVFSLPPNVKESVVPQLAAMMALSARLSNKSLSEAVRTSEEQIARWTYLIDKYLDDLKGKERITLATLRTETLLLLLHKNNLSSPLDLWQRSGNLVRSAMAMGLHRDPESIVGFSIFEKEQRRKLWRSIIELDIQCSLATGMPAAIRSSDFKSRDLLNVDDNDWTEDMTEYPPEKTPDQWTDSIAQIALGASLRDRLDAANILGGPIDIEQDASALVVRASTLERYLHLLPPSIKSISTSGNNENSAGKLFTKIMLDVFIRRPSLALYRTVSLSPISNRYPAARKAAVQSSIAMLSHIDALDPTVADLRVIKDRDLLNHFHVHCKNDIIQAAIMLCIEIRRCSSASRDSNANLETQEEVPWTKHSLTRIVENTLNSLIQRLGEFGSDLKDILPLSIVLQCARSDETIEERRELMRRGAGKNHGGLSPYLA